MFRFIHTISKNKRKRLDVFPLNVCFQRTEKIEEESHIVPRDQQRRPSLQNTTPASYFITGCRPNVRN